MILKRENEVGNCHFQPAAPSRILPPRALYNLQVYVPACAFCVPVCARGMMKLEFTPDWPVRCESNFILFRWYCCARRRRCRNPRSSSSTSSWSSSSSSLLLLLLLTSSVFVGVVRRPSSSVVVVMCRPRSPLDSVRCRRRRASLFDRGGRRRRHASPSSAVAVVMLKGGMRAPLTHDSFKPM